MMVVRVRRAIAALFCSLSDWRPQRVLSLTRVPGPCFCLFVELFARSFPLSFCLPHHDVHVIASICFLPVVGNEFLPTARHVIKLPANLGESREENRSTRHISHPHVREYNFLQVETYFLTFCNISSSLLLRPSPEMELAEKRMGNACVKCQVK